MRPQGGLVSSLGERPLRDTIPSQERPLRVRSGSGNTTSAEILALGAEAGIKANVLFPADAHDHIPHFAGQTIDIGFFREIYQANCVDVGKPVIRREYNDVALAVSGAVVAVAMIERPRQ
ncbi:hypothetical protein MAXJ12_27913 [Mesorhizobium alhagi CCNWXJ12-2]|uniref:Uncharacterized protein n=1 Tax=Mesorhizobium alhagi CCNWXJ12-2 TaxID=1107882 RepID=H0HZE9_9HYPH|nr:hypothetical protein MAXJ12_27913 [Mesorhizobium alhagi CCNWXJ12-2]